MDLKRLSQLKSVHMIGIKGAGMTALAELLKKQGVAVSGSDTDEVFFTDRILKKEKIPVTEHFAPENIPENVKAVIYSTAYTPEKNDELKAAFERKNLPVLSYPEALGLLTQEKMTLAVCGTHGKTTTSALLAETLEHCGLDPSAIVGSRIMNWEGNALSGEGKYLVLEADEYQNKLAQYQPFGAILTSADYDHPDFFPDEKSYEEVFVEFVKKIPAHGVLVYCADSAEVVRIAEHATCKKFSYGFLEGADFQIVEYRPIPPGFLEDGHALRQSFSVIYQGSRLGECSLRLAGRHNALNATAVLAMALFLNQDIETVTAAFKKFSGTERRFEYIGERYGALIYDDYAHHPEEIRVTLRAFRDLFPEKKLHVIFHPHTFTRTKALLTDFAQSFDDADSVAILDIYGSAREEQGGVSSQDLVDLINRFFPGKATHVPSVPELIGETESKMGRQDIVITLGAGNVWEISHALAKKS